jgi:hypothetical protein
MRRVGDLLKDLGFNADSPMTTKEAFLRHLVRAANVVSPQHSLQNEKPTAGDAQLSFDPDILGVKPLELRAKKSGSER